MENGKVCVIYDTEEGYTKRLAGAWNSQKGLPFEVQAFTGEKELISYLDQHTPDVMLVSESNLTYAIREHQGGQLFLLREGEKTGGTTENGEEQEIEKYQPFDSLLDQVMQYSGYQICRKEADIRVTGIYSPPGSEIKTFFALALAREYGQTGKVLYVNLEEFAGLEGLLPPVQDSNLSDAFYYYRQNGNRYHSRIGEMIGEWEGIGYFAPTVCADDLAGMSAAQIISFAQETAAAGGYTDVILDLGYAIGRPWKLLQFCDQTYIPWVMDHHRQKQRIDQLSVYLAGSGRDRELTNLWQVAVPADLVQGEEEDWWEEGCRRLQQFIRHEPAIRQAAGLS